MTGSRKPGRPSAMRHEPTSVQAARSNNPKRSLIVAGFPHLAYVAGSRGFWSRGCGRSPVGGPAARSAARREVWLARRRGDRAADGVLRRDVRPSNSRSVCGRRASSLERRAPVGPARPAQPPIVREIHRRLVLLEEPQQRRTSRRRTPQGVRARGLATSAPQMVLFALYLALHSLVSAPRGVDSPVRAQVALACPRFAGVPLARSVPGLGCARARPQSVHQPADLLAVWPPSERRRDRAQESRSCAVQQDPRAATPCGAAQRSPSERAGFRQDHLAYAKLPACPRAPRHSGGSPIARRALSPSRPVALKVNVRA